MLGHALLSLFLSVHSAKDSGTQKLRVHGYVKTLGQGSFVRDLRTAGYSGILHARINTAWAPHPSWKLRLELRQRLFTGDLVQQPGFKTLVGQDEGWRSLTRSGQCGRDLLWTAAIDRASLSYRHGAWECIAGRQRINWGINTVWNPNDVFNTYNFFDFDYEERPGCDGLRLLYRLPGRGAVEMAAAAGSGNTNRKLALLWRSGLGRYDVQLLGGRYDTLWFAGAGWAGNLSKAGFKGEATAYRKGINAAHAQAALLASVAVDYTFSKGWYVLGSYLFNSNGSNQLAGLGMLSYQKLSPMNLMPLKQQIAVQASRQINPLLQASFTAIYGWSTQLSIFIPAVSLWLAQNWETTLLAQSVFAEMGSRYQSLGQSIFMRMRYSF